MTEDNEIKAAKFKNELTKFKELTKHGSVSQQAELKRIAVEIAKVKDSFQTC